MLDRLTQRAKNILLTVFETNASSDTIDSSKVLNLISSEEGLGYLILASHSKITFKKTSVIAFSSFIEQAFLEAFELKHPYVGTEHLLLSLLKLSGGEKAYKLIQKKIIESGTYPQIPKKISISTKRTPILDAFGVDYTVLADESFREKLINREELSDLSSVLLREKKANPLSVTHCPQV